MLLLALATLFSCAADLESGDIATIDPGIFNLKEFVAEQKEKMAGKSIAKTVSVNGIEETKTLNEVDWELELAPFEQSNIDRPALWDGYKVDTSSCQGLTKLLYTATDQASFTKSIEVTYRDKSTPMDSVYSVLINNGFTSYIAKTSQRLIWWENGYEIFSIQQAILSDKRNLSIRVVWGSGEIGPCVFNSAMEPNLGFYD